MTYEEIIEVEKKYRWKLSSVGLLLMTKEEYEELLKAATEWLDNFEEKCKAEDTE